jgi:subtilisin family serine protease
MAVLPKKTSSAGAASHGSVGRPQSDPTKKPFTPETLDRTKIAIPLLERIRDDGPDAVQNVIIDVNLEYPGGRQEARRVVGRWVEELLAAEAAGQGPSHGRPRKRASAPATPPPAGKWQGINHAKSAYSQQYLFGRLSGENIRALVRRDEAERTAGGRPSPPALYRVWLDHEVARFTNKSVSTVKADAARKAFSAMGKDIVWAVVDTGVDGSHPHFSIHQNLALELPLQHRDFTGLGSETLDELATRACTDKAGHGTHVAGIIAGEFRAGNGKQIVAAVRQRDEMGEITTQTIKDIDVITGMAPECKILSLKVLDDNGEGLASNLIAALEYVQELNGNGRRIMVHGVNMSVGYDFEPKWFACGQSPLCVEVDRLVRSGVVVVVAAGNTGYGYNQPEGKGPVAAGLDLTINDPGNADLGITVGSTHRDMPHVYGVSYFSSKGPTGDGRLKPDLVAPGEKIISCQSRQAPSAEGEASSDQAATGGAGAEAAPGGDQKASNLEVAAYKEDSGTSMAAPHVSGVIAAFLSVRREFIGRPDAVKNIFLSTATDLKRTVYFQGKGLVDLMRAIQFV